MKPNLAERLDALLLSALFCAMIAVPLVLSVLSPDSDHSAIEKRALAEPPALPATLEDIRRYPQALEDYFSDHYGLREFFIRYYRCLVSALGDSPAEDVTIGRDGWLFLGSIQPGYEKYSDPIGDTRNVNRFSPEQLWAFTAYLEGVRDWLARRRVAYLFVIAPNKHTIYRDKLPRYIEPVARKSATEQLLAHLHTHGETAIVYPRDALLAARGEGELYYRGDSHWNSLGADVAQYEIMRHVQRLFPGRVTPRRFPMTVSTTHSKDLALQVGREHLRETEYIPRFGDSCEPRQRPADIELRQTHTLVCDDGTLDVLIFRDSFFTALQPYFARQFARSTYIWETLTYPALKKRIQGHRPDLVIEQWVERRLPTVPPRWQSFTQERNRQRFQAGGHTLFQADLQGLRLNRHLQATGSGEQGITLEATGPNPGIVLPQLPVRSGVEYQLRVSFTASRDSKLTVFYAVEDAGDGPRFTHGNSHSLPVQQGENDVYIALWHTSPGPWLRVDPLQGRGNLTLTALELRRAGGS